MKQLFNNLPSYLVIKQKLNAWRLIFYYSIIGGFRLIPPRSLRFVGGGNYLIVGYDFFMLFQDLAGIQPHYKILDVGCGTGRISVPLTKYLSKEGEYHGFDIVKSGIDWCNKKITSKFPNFRYLHANIYNKAYNQTGTIKPTEFQFPYDNEKFDFIFLTSVFAHLHSEDIQHYLSEISRVLKKDGKCFITYFIINDESKELIKKGKSSQDIKYQLNENSFTKNEEIPEAAIGVTEEFIRKTYDSVNLRIKEPIYFGSWCEREDPKSYQDIIIAEKV